MLISSFDLEPYFPGPSSIDIFFTNNTNFYIYSKSNPNQIYPVSIDTNILQE